MFSFLNFNKTYKTTINNIEIYFHPLTRKDYLEIARLPEENFDSEVIKRCILNDINDILISKIISELSKRILRTSGFFIEEEEEELSNSFDILKSSINNNTDIFHLSHLYKCELKGCNPIKRPRLEVLQLIQKQIYTIKHIRT